MKEDYLQVYPAGHVLHSETVVSENGPENVPSGHLLELNRSMSSPVPSGQ